MRGTTHPKTRAVTNSLLFFFYSIPNLRRVPALFHPLEFVIQGAPEPRAVGMRYNSGGASTESQFPDSPEWVTTKDHPSTPALVCRQRNAAMPWKGLPPHRIVSLLVVKFGQRKRRYAVEGAAPPPHCSSRLCFWGRRKTPLCRGRDCPPTALFPRLWYFVVMTCL